jgi:hypothetical protein
VKEERMKRNQLLFVTYHDENFDDGLSYAVDLAKTMNDSIEILMIYKRKVLDKLGDMRTAITFAEAGEYQIAGDDRRGLQKKMGTTRRNSVIGKMQSGVVVVYAAIDAVSHKISSDRMRGSIWSLSPSSE